MGLRHAPRAEGLAAGRCIAGGALGARRSSLPRRVTTKSLCGAAARPAQGGRAPWGSAAPAAPCGGKSPVLWGGLWVERGREGAEPTVSQRRFQGGAAGTAQGERPPQSQTRAAPVMVLLLHVLFSRLLLPLFSPPFPSTSSLLSPILLPLFFSFVSFHSVPPACREQPPEGTELWDPQAGGQPAEEPLGAHLAAGRLGGSVQVHATTRRGHGRAWGTAEPTRARPKRACRPCQAAAPLLRPGPRTPGSWPGCDTPAQGWPRVMPGAPLPARGRGWRCFPGLPLGLAGQLEMGTAPALLRVCPGHGLTPSGDFPLPPSLEWSGGFEPGFSSLSLGSPQPRLPASVPSLRRQPPARRLLPLPRAGRLQPARSGGGTCTRGPERPPAGPVLLPLSLLPSPPPLLTPAAL